MRSTRQQRTAYLSARRTNQPTTRTTTKPPIQNDTDTLLTALRASTPIPHHLRASASALLNELVYDTPEAANDQSPPPPRIAVTTSHDPSGMLRGFARHMALLFNGLHLVRGRATQEALNSRCVADGVTHLILLHETKGRPSRLTLCRYPNGPSYHFSLFSVKWGRRERSVGEKALLVVDGMGSEIGRGLQREISLMFPAVGEAGRVVAFINREGTVGFRHYLVEGGAGRGKRLVEECGMDMRLYRVVNGVLGAEECGYVLNAFTNTRAEDVLG